MKVVYLTGRCGRLAWPSVVSIGNFDGLHLGHRQILKTVVRAARELGVQSVAMTFSPHPIQFLAPDRAPNLISTLGAKDPADRSSTGIDLLFVAPFDQRFRALSPERLRPRVFDRWLEGACGLRRRQFQFRISAARNDRNASSVRVAISKSSKFRPFEFAERSSAARGFASSSRQAKYLRACRLLGRWIEIEGKIVSGAGRGRTMKFRR